MREVNKCFLLVLGALFVISNIFGSTKIEDIRPPKRVIKKKYFSQDLTIGFRIGVISSKLDGDYLLFSEHDETLTGGLFLRKGIGSQLHLQTEIGLQSVGDNRTFDGNGFYQEVVAAFPLLLCFQLVPEANVSVYGGPQLNVNLDIASGGNNYVNMPSHTARAGHFYSLVGGITYFFPTQIGFLDLRVGRVVTNLWENDDYELYETNIGASLGIIF